MDETAYYRNKQLALSKSLQNTKKIYLDTKFWLIFRDVMAGRERSNEDSMLFQHVYSLVASGQAICPFSEEVLLEIKKQSDPKTLEESINVIDQLSKGVCFVSIDERVKHEIKNLLSLSPDQTLESLSMPAEIWTKSGYVLGFVGTEKFLGDSSPPEEIRKSMIDYAWDINLSKVLKQGGPEEFLDGLMPIDVSDELNSGKSDHAHENTSYEQMYRSELGGIVDVYSEHIRSVWKSYCTETGRPPNKEMLDSGQSMVQKVLFNGTKHKKLMTVVPTIHILASIHASTRWDKSRKYGANDWSDFNHAIYALPYCDYFFTEKSLRALLVSKKLEFDKLYECEIFRRSSDALCALKKGKTNKSVQATAEAAPD